MKRPQEIGITRIQLNELLNEEEKNGFAFLLDIGVYCATCNGTCTEGVQVNGLKLNKLNDILISGACNKCGGTVRRYVEFGESPEFYKKATEFRKTLDN